MADDRGGDAFRGAGAGDDGLGADDPARRRGSVLKGLRRLLAIFAVVAGVTGAVSLLAGLAFGSSASRSVATGFYLVGVLVLVLGVAAGVRGPLRAKRVDDRETMGSLFGVGVSARGVRPATAEEQRDAAAVAGLLLGLGLALILVAIGADSDTDLLGR
jgi:hypothetical protein